MANRKLYIVGAIDEALYAKFSLEMDDLLSENNKKPITIEICSGGGEDAAAFAIYGKMMASSVPLHVMAYGEIQSAAVLLLAAGDRRYADAQVDFMVHESASELEGETHVVLAAAKRLEKSECKYYTLLANHTETTYEQWRELAKTTTFFTSEDALRYGLIDKIVGEKKNR